MARKPRRTRRPPHRNPAHLGWPRQIGPWRLLYSSPGGSKLPERAWPSPAMAVYVSDGGDLVIYRRQPEGGPWNISIDGAGSEAGMDPVTSIPPAALSDFLQFMGGVPDTHYLVWGLEDED